MTLEELEETIASAESRGFDLGLEHALHDLREQIEEQIRAELVDSTCPLCVARREIANVRAELEIVRIDRQRLRANSRGWQIRDGRYRYRATRTTKN